MSSDDVFSIGYNDAIRALNDQSFIDKFPMFRAVRSNAEYIKSGVKTGCSSCRQKAMAKNVLLDFLNVLKTLPENVVKDIKEYYGVGRMMYNMYDSEKGIYITKVV